MHHMDAHEMNREKAKLKLHKNATSYFEQILEATPHETAAVELLTLHLKDQPILLLYENNYS